MPSTTSSHDSDPDVHPPPSSLAGLGYDFADPAHLDLALRHRSWCAENGGVESNERLEFLGDAVLGLVITDHLFSSTPTAPEGVLARRRAELVNSATLADLARELDLGAALKLGKGEEATGGRQKGSILADALEAVFGAVYLDGGIGAVRGVILALFEGRISDVETGEYSTDHKSRLQELAARRFSELPRYTLSEDGPEHEKTFSASVCIGGEVLGHGEGRTKKEAEQHAAQQAHDRLAVNSAGDPASRNRPGANHTSGDDDA